MNEIPLEEDEDPVEDVGNTCSLCQGPLNILGSCENEDCEAYDGDEDLSDDDYDGDY